METQDKERDIAAANAAWKKAGNLSAMSAIKWFCSMKSISHFVMAILFRRNDAVSENEKPPMTHVVLTDAMRPGWIKMADLVTEMALVNIRSVRSKPDRVEF